MPQDTGIADVDIDLPLTHVYEKWTRFETFPLFISPAVEVVQLSSTVLHWRVAFGNDCRDFDAVITEQISHRVISWRSLGPRIHAGAVTFEALGEHRTRVQLAMAWDHRILSEPAPRHSLTCDARVGADLDVFAQLIHHGVLGPVQPRLIGVRPEGLDTTVPEAPTAARRVAS